MRTSAITTALAGLSAVLLIASPAGAQASPSSKPALDDPTIVAIFDAANTVDIETGGLAAKRAHSKEVRDYAAMLVHDHTAVRQQGRDLAKKLGVTPTPPADSSSARAHAQAMKELRAASGQKFDQVFLQHEVDFHRNVIDAVQTTLLPAIKNAELKAFVVKVAPAFQAHMIAAEQLQKSLGEQQASTAKSGSGH
jgi:putative membrane protein